MTIQYDNLNTTISAVGSATDIPINIQPKGTGGLNLLGSGQNLILQSNTFNTTWAATAASVAIGQSDPFGGSTAWALTEDSATSGHYVGQSLTVTNGVTYILSCYLKANTRTCAQLIMTGIGTAQGNVIAGFDLSAGTTVGASAGGTAAIVSVGSGWYRCSVWVVSTITTSVGIQIRTALTSSTTAASYAGNGTSNIYIYGSQLELGSTANTYVPTTTAAIYGTPTLTLSGVAGVGLQSDGSLYVQPAGTGAIQASPTTSTIVGGNARGANAVDWQTVRGAAGHVASGIYSVISGGIQNSVTGSISGILSGGFNGVGGQYAVVAGGAGNAAGNYACGIVAGQANQALGYFNLIGGGFTNSGTSGSAVTTQSATMNGTTAVTLSGSNANIKVGQLITGTNISNFTYVAAVSGTSLTLSQAAAGSSTNTLSFWTPHGVVVGGGNNQATGSYSFIGGGGDAGTAANRNAASGDYSVVVGGRNNSASGIASFIGGGGFEGASAGSNVASGTCSSVLGGFGNNSSGAGASITGGFQNTASGSQTSVVGGRRGTTRSIVGNTVFPASENPIADAAGVSQTALLVLAVQTTDATATALRSNGSAAGTTNQVILPNNSAYFFRGEVISGVTGGGNTKGWTIEGVIKRGANAASTALVGTPTVTSMYADVGAATWTIAVTADTTNGGLAVTFTGQAGTTIRTVAQIRTTEMTY